MYGNEDMKRCRDQFRSNLGYVPQDDIIHRTLSVKDALYYSSKLRLPADIDDTEVENRIDSVLKKLIFMLFVIAAVAGSGFAVSQGLIPQLRTEKHELKEMSMRFFECIKFKEFGEAADFHNAEDKKSADIPKMLEGLFQVPPENMDINDIYVVTTEINSSGVLAKVKLQMSVKMLNTGKQKNPEVNLFWKKENDKWYLKLKSSLRKSKGF